MQWGGECRIYRKKRYEDVRLNIIIVTRGWAGVNFPEKKRYVTLQWPPRQYKVDFHNLSRQQVDESAVALWRVCQMEKVDFQVRLKGY